ncbi:MAG: IPT/TIG domain-containing protein, partial [Saprospiraceae bacterium]
MKNKDPFSKLNCVIFLLMVSMILSANDAYAQPIISSFSPVTGGKYSTVMITGSNFSNVTAVKFGSTPALYFFVQSSTSIMAIVDDGTTGNVTVQTTAGLASLPGFIFVLPPVVTSFAPVTGSIGTPVTIKGTRFTGATIVIFGGIMAQSFTVLSDSVIDATVGAGASGGISVYTIGGGGSLDGFTHFGPAIQSFSPTGGPAGTVVTISGKYLTSTTSVTFQGIPASSFTILSDSVLEAVTAPGSFGMIQVSSPAGAGSINGFNIPKITSFTPLSGSYLTSCTIRGANFTGTTSVVFEDSAALAFSIISDSVIEATVGIGRTGRIKVINPYSQGFSQNIFNFIYLRPSMNSFAPDSGSTGTIVTVKGNHFAGIDDVLFGDSRGASLRVLTDSTMTAVVTDGSSGNVIISNQAGYATSVKKFTFTGPKIESFAPLKASPGDTVTINGSNFANVSALRFGGTPSPF